MLRSFPSHPRNSGIRGQIHLFLNLGLAYDNHSMKSKIITVIPVYNGEKFIEQTLESVAKQTLRPDRLVVLDNCSTDGTEGIVKGFKPIQCEWIRNPKNLGLFGNCNRALEFASE